MTFIVCEAYLVSAPSPRHILTRLDNCRASPNRNSRPTHQSQYPYPHESPQHLPTPRSPHTQQEEQPHTPLLLHIPVRDESKLNDANGSDIWTQGKRWSTETWFMRAKVIEHGGAGVERRMAALGEIASNLSHDVNCATKR